jgi:uncharacterized membrane protein YhiD involved in acid resistance
MDFLTGVAATSAIDLRTALLAILVAFVCSHVLAVVYVWSYRGLSYSQSFVQTLVMAGVATSMMMVVIGNNVVWGIGMVGALALVRFRTNLRDSRDMIFVFASLVVGLACGTRAFAVAISGTILFSLVAMYLSRVSFGLKSYFDALLRLTIAAGDGASEAAQTCLKQHCSRFALAMVQQVAQGAAAEHVYQVRFRRERSREDLVRDLERVEGVSNLSLMLEETRVEI